MTIFHFNVIIYAQFLQRTKNFTKVNDSLKKSIITFFKITNQNSFTLWLDKKKGNAQSSFFKFT